MATSPSTPEVLGTKVLHAGHPPTSLDFVRFSDGSTANYLRIDFGDSARVLALNGRGEILFIEGYSHGLGRTSLRLPAGGAQAGETPRTAARRELIEETGYDAKELRRFLTLNAIPGYARGTSHVFLGRGLRRVRREVDRTEVDRVRFVPVAEALKLVRHGTIVSASVIATILYARERGLV